MLNIEVLCVGKVNADYFAAGCAEFVKRAGGLANVRVTELPEETIREKNAGEATIRKALEKEGVIGSVYPYLMTTTGNSTSVADATRMGKEMAEVLVSAGVDGVILTST